MTKEVDSNEVCDNPNKPSTSSAKSEPPKAKAKAEEPQAGPSRSQDPPEVEYDSDNDNPNIFFTIDEIEARVRAKLIVPKKISSTDLENLTLLESTIKELLVIVNKKA